MGKEPLYPHVPKSRSSKGTARERGLPEQTKMKLWRENRIDQEWESTFEEIYRGYKASEWYDVAYPLERKLALYMTDSKYLNSTYEKDDFLKLVDYIIKRRRLE